jgi:hypothetical protein
MAYLQVVVGFAIFVSSLGLLVIGIWNVLKRESWREPIIYVILSLLVIGLIVFAWAMTEGG